MQLATNPSANIITSADSSSSSRSGSLAKEPFGQQHPGAFRHTPYIQHDMSQNPPYIHHSVAQSNAPMPPPPQQQQQQQQHQQQPQLTSSSDSQNASDAKPLATETLAEKKDDKAAPVRKRLSLACTTCRQRKVKCDGGRPSCRTCAKFSWPCVYQPSNRKRGPRPRALALMDGAIPYSGRAQWHTPHGYYAYGFPGRSPPPPPPQHLMPPFFGQHHDIPMNGAPVRLEPARAQPGSYNHDAYSSYGDYMSNSGVIRIRPPPARSPVYQTAPPMPTRTQSHNVPYGAPHQHHHPHHPQMAAHGALDGTSVPPPPPLFMPHQHGHPAPSSAHGSSQYADQSMYSHPHQQHQLPPPQQQQPQPGPHPQTQLPMYQRPQSPFSPTSSSGISPHSARPHYAQPEAAHSSVVAETNNVLPSAPSRRYTQNYTLQPPPIAAPHTDRRPVSMHASDAPRYDPLGPASNSTLGSASERQISVVSLTTPSAAAAEAAGFSRRELEIVPGKMPAESEISGSALASSPFGSAAAPQPLHQSASSYAPDMRPQSMAAEMHIPAIYARKETDITSNRDFESGAGAAPNARGGGGGREEELAVASAGHYRLSSPAYPSCSYSVGETPMSVPMPSSSEFYSHAPNGGNVKGNNEPSYYRPQQKSPLSMDVPSDARSYTMRSPEHPRMASASASDPALAPSPKLLPFSDGTARPRLPTLSEVFGKDYRSMRSPGGLH